MTKVCKWYVVRRMDICCLFLYKNLMYQSEERKKKVRGRIKVWKKIWFSMWRTIELLASNTVTAKSLPTFVFCGRGIFLSAIKHSRNPKALEVSHKQFFRKLRKLSGTV